MEVASSENRDAEEAEDLLRLFQQSKAGWRRRPVTATRQSRQLRTIFARVSDSVGEARPDEILLKHADKLEEAVRADLPGRTALVKSNVIAILEFARYVSARQPVHADAWTAVMRRVESWKKDATALDLHRAADVQDRMGEEGYLPSKEELKLLRGRTLDELGTATGSTVSEPTRTDAVRVRRLMSVALLCDNFQRSGAVSNATLDEYRQMRGGILRVHEHKSRASYGSINLVVGERLQQYLNVYVEKFRPILLKSSSDKLFPTSKVCDDVSAVCGMFGLRPFNPTMMRKAMGSTAYGSVSETQRRKIANHMTHRPETAFKAYSAKNRRSEALESVNVMAELMYGDGDGSPDRALEETSTIPSSAGAMARRISFSPDQLYVLEREVRTMSDARGSRFMSMARVLQLMSKHKPLFDSHSPRTVEEKLRSLLTDSGTKPAVPKRRRLSRI